MVMSKKSNIIRFEGKNSWQQSWILEWGILRSDAKFYQEWFWRKNLHGQKIKESDANELRNVNVNSMNRIDIYDVTTLFPECDLYRGCSTHGQPAENYDVDK